MKLKNLLVLAGLMVVTPTGNFQAATTTQRPTLKAMLTEFKDACRSDIDQLCKGVTPGEGRIAACLNSKEDQLSPKCDSSWTGMKTEISKRMDRAEVAFRRDCGSDVKKFCSGVPAGKGRLLECLDEHQGSLSNSCQKFEAKLEKKLREFVG